MATLVKQNFIRICSSQPLLAQMVWCEKTPKMLGKINPPFETLESIRYRFSNVVSRQRQPSFAFSVSLILKIRNCKIPNLLFLLYLPEWGRERDSSEQRTDVKAFTVRLLLLSCFGLDWLFYWNIFACCRIRLCGFLTPVLASTITGMPWVRYGAEYEVH